MSARVMRRGAETISGEGPKLTEHQQRRANSWIKNGTFTICGQTKRGPDKITPCPEMAGGGTDHPGYGPCRGHGGTSASGKMSAARERAFVQVAELKRASRFYGQVIQISAEQALQEEVGRSVGVVRWIEDKIAQWGAVVPIKLNEETGLPPLIEMVEGFRAVAIGDSEYAAWLRMYQIERAHLARVAKACIDAGLSAKMVGLWEMQADMMYKIITLTCEKLGVDPDRLPAVMPQIIEAVTNERMAIDQ